MEPRERFLAALRGEMPDRIPFVIWSNKLPNEQIKQQLLDCGACIINKSSVYKHSTPSIEVEVRPLEPVDGIERREIVYHTEGGELTVVERLSPGSIWIEKMPFSDPLDYEPLEAFVRSKVYTPCFDDFMKSASMYGGSSTARPETIYTPIQDLICKYMGVETFCIEWADRRERLLELCEVIAVDRRKRLDIVADSPADYVIIEGNVITDVTGPERFEEFHLPYIQQACELLHKHGKLAGAHLDDNNMIMVDVIGRSSLDLIESFTPPPDCNLSLSQALESWPDKTLQINFPSSLHLGGVEVVRKAAVELIREASPGKRFIVGVSEDISGGGLDTLFPLARTVYDNGKTPIEPGF